MKYRVDLCETAPQTLVRIPLEIRPTLLAEGIAGGLHRITEVAARAGLTASGSPTITFHRELPAGDTVSVDFALPIEPAPALGPSSGAELVIQPPMLVARTSHRGPYTELDAAYQALRSWLEENGCTPTGPPTEAYLVGPDEISDPHQLITEIRVPIAPAPTLVAHLAAPFDRACRRVREVLRHQGFTILHETDLRALLGDTAGEQVEEYLLLTVYDPGLTVRALAADRRAGLHMPCSMTIRAEGSGVLVEIADPQQQMAMLHEPALAEVGVLARRRFAAALDALAETAPDAQVTIDPRNEE